MATDKLYLVTDEQTDLVLRVGATSDLILDVGADSGSKTDLELRTDEDTA